MDKIWKDIEGYEGFYQVSCDGDIRSIACRRCLHGQTRIIHRIKDMTPTDNGNGYLVVQLKSNGKRKPFYVHRLVAEAFVSKPEQTNVVNHKDFNTKNNHANNLEWTTQKENVLYSSERMRHPKKVSKPTNTGEKYISKVNHKGKVKYRVKGNKLCSTLEEAIAYRNEVLGIG